MNPLVVIGAVALIGFLATLGGAAADENGVTIINGNGGAGIGNGNGNGLGQGNGIGNGNGNGNGNGQAPVPGGPVLSVSDSGIQISVQ